MPHVERVMFNHPNYGYSYWQIGCFGVNIGGTRLHCCGRANYHDSTWVWRRYIVNRGPYGECMGWQQDGFISYHSVITMSIHSSTFVIIGTRPVCGDFYHKWAGNKYADVWRATTTAQNWNHWPYQWGCTIWGWEDGLPAIGWFQNPTGTRLDFVVNSKLAIIGLPSRV